MSNLRIRRVAPDGTIHTIAGIGRFGYSGDGGPAAAATFGRVLDLAFDTAGNLYLADFDFHVIRKIGTGGTITTVAGSGQPGFGGDGGPATSARLNVPRGIEFDAPGNLYVAEQGNNRVRRITVAGVISTFAGDGAAITRGDGGAAVLASITSPGGLAFDPAGNLYVTEIAGNTRIRRISPGGIISTFAGGSAFGYSGDGGPALAAILFT